MPRGERSWNPYRWVRVADQPIQHAKPGFHHQFSGLSGRIQCELEALTPLLIGDGQGQGNFIRSRKDNKPFIPGTSLKGAIRALAELVGNAAVPSDRDQSDSGHAASQASRGDGQNWQLDIVARMFGYLGGRKAFAGLVRFSDAHLLADKAPIAGSFKVAGGQPHPAHRPFYPDNERRKLYHHQIGATGLTPPHGGIREDQKRTVHPLTPGTTFGFRVDFSNLRDEELSLLCYCLVLEKEVEVSLSVGALGPKAHEPITITGPMRHKVGGCKPQGGGSCHIRLTRLVLCTDPAARYRGQSSETEFTDAALANEIDRRTHAIRSRTDVTIRELRAMMLYPLSDPRNPVNYPTYQWFQAEKERASGTPLKPTL